jgi:hypothetical protein
MEMHYLLYASRLVSPLTHDDLVSLLEVSQRNNGKNGLSGFLHIEDNIVLQYLEGPPEPLLRTVQRIRKDPRHNQFVTLAEDVIRQRFFDGWQMALVESTTLSLFDLLGVQIKDIPTVQEANPLDLISLLSANASFLRDRPSIA